MPLLLHSESTTLHLAFKAGSESDLDQNGQQICTCGPISRRTWAVGSADIILAVTMPVVYKSPLAPRTQTEVLVMVTRVSSLPVSFLQLHSLIDCLNKVLN
jgi:hypothetical protein